MCVNVAINVDNALAKTTVDLHFSINRDKAWMFGVPVNVIDQTIRMAIGGLLLLTLHGSTLSAPMGWTIIGGLLVSTLLTLIMVPVLYKVFSKSSLSNAARV